MDLFRAPARSDFPMRASLPAPRAARSGVQPGREIAVQKFLHPARPQGRAARPVCGSRRRGAVCFHALDGPAIPMECSPGPWPGNLAWAGRDGEATETLGEMIQTLHTARPDLTTLEPLSHRFAPKTGARLEGDPGAAAELARDHLAEPALLVALPVELQHDNALSSPRGWLANDPKVSGAIRLTSPPMPSATPRSLASASSTPTASTA